MSSNAWNTVPPTYDSNSVHTTQLRPYLQLSHLLSLTWLAYPILSLVFVVFRLQLSLSTSQAAVASAKADLLTSCQAAEKAATGAASMPRYMAFATNEQIANAVNDSMNAAREALILALTVMEVIINFIVDTYRSTFLCFLELVIRGGLAILLGAVDVLNGAVQAAAGGLSTAIQGSFSTANSALQGVAKVASKLGISVPTLTAPDLSSLQNVALPQSFTDSITALNNSIPDFSELKQIVDQFIDTPFELVKADINETFFGLSFNSSVLAVPEQNDLSFCTDLDTSFIDSLGKDLVKMTKIGIIIIILVIFVLIALNCLLEWYKWRCQRRHLEYTRQAWNTDPTIYHQTSGGTPNVTLSDHNLLMLQANGAHPLLTRIANTVSAKLRLSSTKHVHLQWFLHYIFHPPALACFLIGFFGLLSVELQLLALRPLVDKYTAQAASTTADFSNTIATSINASMYNQSAAYASSINAHVDTIQSSINDGLFGWVNSTTTTLNTTIENFYEDIQSVVNHVFNGTILDSPIQEFIKCIIGTKVDAIEDALTFLHNNLNINIARVNDSILVLSPASVNETAQPIAAAAVGENGDGGFVGRLVNSYAASLRQERVMFVVFMLLWGVVVLMGLSVILWHSYGQPYLETRRRRRWETEQRSLPFAEGKGYGADSVAEQQSELPAPLPSPKRGASFKPFAFVRSASLKLKNSDAADSLEKPNNWSHGDKGYGADSVAEQQSELSAPLPSPKRGASFKPFAFVRSASPKSKNSDAADSLEKPNKGSQESFFDKPKSSHSNISVKDISKPVKLVSFSQRSREIFVGDRKAPVAPEPEPEPEPESESELSERRSTKWFARFAERLVKKEEGPAYPEFSPKRNSGGSARPSLTIDLPAYEPASGPNSQQDHSRWSVSPPPVKPWMGIVSPAATPWRHKHKPSVPSNVPSVDVKSISEVAMAPAPVVQPTPLAMPLHSGFEVPRKQPIHPRHPGVAYASLAPDMRHRRSLSLPSVNGPSSPPGLAVTNGAAPNTPPTSTNPFSDAPADDSVAVTPGTRSLTTMEARRSNPFATPFDDEHRETIVHDPAGGRKSMNTNPFAALAL